MQAIRECVLGGDYDADNRIWYPGRPGAAGAPRFRIAADWTDRLKQGLDTLYINAIKGKGAMPAKGLCPDCSDKEIELAVDYMLEGI